MGEVVENQDVPRQQEADDKTWQLDINELKPMRPEASQNPEARRGCLSQLFGKANKVNEYYKLQQEICIGYSEMDKLNGLDARWEPDTTHARGSITRYTKCIHNWQAFWKSFAHVFGNHDSVIIVKEEREKIKNVQRFTIRISNISNIIIFIAKVTGSVKSASLVIIASTLDSFLNLLSGFILWFVAHSMRKWNPYVYPIGKKRMQPLGILVFSVIMVTLGLQVIIESVRNLLSSGPHNSDQLQGAKFPWVVSIMTGTSVVKLGLTFYCWSSRHHIVRTYGKDHLFDVMTNMYSLWTAWLADRFYCWIDPAGAILLALYTMRTWSMTAAENVRALNSRTASPDFLSKLAYLAWNHHNSILFIDTVRAFTLGTHAFVELGIVLPNNMPFRWTEDIRVSLQNKIESLPEVERAYVNLHYNYQHKPEHAVPDYELNLNLPQPLERSLK